MRERKSETIDFNLEDWFDQSLQRLRAQLPDVETMVDLPALRLAMLDAAAARVGVFQADIEGIELLGDIFLDLPNLMQLVATEVVPQPRFVPCVQRLAVLFSAQEVHTLDAKSLRCERRDAFLDLLDLLMPVIERRVGQIANNKQKREEYAHRRLPLVDVGVFFTVNDPCSTLIAEEAASGVFETLTKELSPKVLDALRDLLLQPSETPCYKHAERHGVSAATMSRAKNRFIQLVVERLRDAPNGVAAPFQSAVERVFSKQTA